MAQDQSIISPRIQTLYRKIESGDPLALDEFWREIQTLGTPLVEDIGEVQNHVLVTFLWRADSNCTNVFLFGGLAHPDQMARLANTNLWFKSYHVRRDARFTYELGPSNQLTERQESGWNPDLAAWQPDPRNPHRRSFAHDSEGSFSGYTVSLLELPEAPPQPWIETKENVISGETQLIHYQSHLLQNERRVWIYTPPNMTTGGELYDLLILFDGFVYSQVIPTPTILDNLLADNRIRPTIAVMLDSPDRQDELSVNSKFINFMVEEFVPWIRTNYPITDDAARTTLGGSSAGGLVALYAALQHPHLFGQVISQSGAFWLGDSDSPNWLIEKVVSLSKQPLSLYLDVGIYEPPNLSCNQKMRDVLTEKGYNLRYIEWSSTHEPLSWQGGLAEAFLTLLTVHR